MSAELLKQVNNNYITACILHRELADVMWFLYLPGYAMLHEYQLLDESMTQRRLKRYISSTYHIYVSDYIPESAEIAENLLKDKNRKELTSDETCDILKKSFKAYVEWEEKSLKKYQKIAAELLQSGDVSDFNYMGNIIKDVKSELTYITDKMIELEAMSWDMPQIVAEQPDYIERYEYLIRILLGESKQYHHYNSNLDSESRISILDKYPDKF